ncbi:OpgC domain-containing protein [Devosia sp. 1566]|uniref:OpgC family protein n=1 Tax=Devosia sp. 1566 TaxID=2499144 RepID=UPI000FDB9F00|nr:OpgC domain-containing protein [Devosia sp. 1566]
MSTLEPAVSRTQAGHTLRTRGTASGALAREASAPASRRDPRLDMFRGLALVMIFINHVPGTIYENFTSRNFGFSDAAEAFVFMSGLAAGLAYSNSFRTGSFWAGLAKVWARARQLYLVHLTMTVVTLAIFAAGALWFGLPNMLLTNNVAALFKQPLGVMIGIPLLSHQLGYLNILPLYFVLLLATPALLWAGLRKPLWVMAGSVLVWIVAGQFRLNFPSYPAPGGWFLGPLSWQILFIVGLLSGAAMKVGESLVPANKTLFRVALGFVLFVLLWARIPALAEAGRGVLGALSRAGLPFYITWFDKTYLALPRLLHALALFYVFACLPWTRQIAGSPYAAPLRWMGQQGLAVFATGTLISMALQTIKTGVSPDPLLDGAMLLAGLAMQLLLAWTLVQTARLRRRSSPAPA